MKIRSIELNLSAFLCLPINFFYNILEQEKVLIYAQNEKSFFYLLRLKSGRELIQVLKWLRNIKLIGMCYLMAYIYILFCQITHITNYKTSYRFSSERLN